MKAQALNKLCILSRIPVLLLVLSCVLIEVRSVMASNTETLKKLYSKDYAFTEDYFSFQKEVFEKVLALYKGRPNIQYLEIGTFEGASAFWMLENILTHPSAKMTCIDPFGLHLYKRFTDNLKLSGLSDKVDILKGFSQVKLRALPLKSFDIIYIDGSHVPKDVLIDAVLSWGLLKRGGIMLLDDYLLNTGEQNPKVAIDPFLNCFKDELEIIYNGYLIVVRKR